MTRVDGRPAVTVNGDITAEDTGSVAREVESNIDELDLPPGVEVQVGGVLSQIEESFNSMYIGIGLAIILVYIVMVVFFGSLLSPSRSVLVAAGKHRRVLRRFITQNILGCRRIGLLMLVGIGLNAIVLMDPCVISQQDGPLRGAGRAAGRASGRYR
jgi:HAE1 family hydrophobic/amphiphilic exporter-1